MYLLLDTNILIDLLIKGREEHFIDQLEILHHLKLIQFLVPKTLKEEWVIKRRQTITHHKNTAVEFGKLSPGNEGYMQDMVTAMEEKGERIDRLLDNGIQISLHNKTIIAATKMVTGNTLPFSGKDIKDALIYYSTVAYLQKKKIVSYIFVTNNGSDFGNNGNKSRGLHPNLIISGQTCIYLPSLALFFQTYKTDFHLHFNKEKEDRQPGTAIQVIRKENKNLLLYLYDVLQLCEQKIAFMPLDILARIHPFRVQTIHNNYSYYEGYTLHTNNKELFDLFSMVDMNLMRFRKSSIYRNTQANLTKLEYILVQLNKHFVFNLSLTGKHSHLDIECPLVRLRKLIVFPLYYEGYNWKTVLVQLNSKTLSVHRAHLLFQVGRFADAFHIYYELFKVTRKNKNRIGLFILLHNLKYVANYLNIHGSEQLAEALQEIDGLDIEKEYFGFASSTRIDGEIARFIRNAGDLEYYDQKIAKDLTAIQDHYESQLRASYSNNSNYSLLLNHFAVFERYTFINAFCYTSYTDFHRTCTAFIRGIFLSYSLNKYQPTRINYFDGFHLEIMSRFGKPEQLLSLYNKHVKKEIAYNKGDGAYESMVISHFSISKEVLEQLLKDAPTTLSNEFYRITWNLLVIMSLVSTDKKILRKVWSALPHILSVMPVREKYDVNYFGAFLQVRGDNLNDKEWKEIFHLCIHHPGLHHHSLFANFSAYAKEKCKPFITSQKEFDEIIPVFFEKCKVCGERHTDILYSLHAILSPDLRKQLVLLIESNLRDKQDWNLLYKAAIFEIITPHEFLPSYIEAFALPAERQAVFLEGEATLRGISDLFNLLFKYDIPIPASLSGQLKNYSQYYAWLADMENFDYDNFDPLWIIQYNTSSYLKKIFSMPKVRQAVKFYLTKHYQPTLAQHYSQFVEQIENISS